MHKTIVTAEELLPIQGEVRFVDARPEREAYALLHLRGAVHAGLDVHLSARRKEFQDGGRHPLPPLETWVQTVAGWGLGPEAPVVVYDDANGSNAGARAWW